MANEKPEGGGKEPQNTAPVEEPRIRAIFRSLVRGENDTEELKLDYPEETKRDIHVIVRNRVAKLISKYCVDMGGQLETFAKEYGPSLGLENATDSRHVAHRLYLLFDSARTVLPVINQTLSHCIDSVNATEESLKLDKNHEIPFSIMSCMTIEKRRVHMDDAAEKDWHVTAVADSALDALGNLLRCPHEMTPLAWYQLDAEYKRDGIRGAEVAGKISLERRDALLANIPIPTRAQYAINAKKLRIKALKIEDPPLDTQIKEVIKDEL